MAIFTTPDSYTKLLIHSDSTDNSTDIVDSSPSKHSLTLNGDVKHEQNEKKFGATSLQMFNTTDAANTIEVAASSDFDFGTGDFTIDCWIYPKSVGYGDWAGICAFGPYPIGRQTLYQFRFYDTTSKLYLGGDSGSFTGTNEVSLNQWSHVAVTRQDTTIRFFINGELDSTHTGANANYVSDGNIVVGHSWRGYGYHAWNGYIDEFRISKGIARWTSNFTPPNKPYDIINTDTQTVDSKEDSAFEVTGGGNAQFGSSIVTRSDPSEASGDSLFSVSAKDGTTLMDVDVSGRVALSDGGISSISGTLVVADDTWTDMYDFGTNDGLYIVFAYIDNYAGQSWSAYRICRVTGYSTIGGAGANATYFQLRDDGTKVQVWHSTDETTVTYKILRIF